MSLKAGQEAWVKKEIIVSLKNNQVHSSRLRNQKPPWPTRMLPLI
jgi:hypothetical protein